MAEYCITPTGAKTYHTLGEPDGDQKMTHCGIKAYDFDREVDQLKFVRPLTIKKIPPGKKPCSRCLAAIKKLRNQ